VRWLEDPLCRRCGREVEFAGAPCPCRHRQRALSRLRSAAAYEACVEKAIHRFKYEGWRALAPALAGLLLRGRAGEEPAATIPATASVLAVPLHPRRLAARGYNQSELLAADLRRRLGLSAPQGRLVRVRDTPPQVGLDRVRRRENVAGAFAWEGPAPGPHPMVLLDDVTTTGATLEACAAALRAAGRAPVLGLTVARVRL
jgi:ComF family protein